MKKTIAYIVSTLMRSGPTNQIYYLIKYLDRSSYKPVIITLLPEPDNSMWQNLKSLDVEIFSLNLPRIKGLFFDVSRLREILERFEVDIIHTHGIRADTIAAKYLNNYSTIATLRNNPFCDNPLTFGKITGCFMAFHHLKMLKKIDFPIAVSKSISKLLLKRNYPEIEVIPNGVDTDIFKPVDSSSQKEQLRRNLDIPISARVFVSTGFLSSLKDPLTIINAFQYCGITKEYYLIFLGDGTLRSFCEKHARENASIKFCGRVTNVSEYLQASDFFISAAQTEGLPNTVIEAMACGLPCILSDIEPHKEILEYNNSSGKLFKTKNAESLTKAINGIVNGDYLSMSRSACDVAQNHLNAKKMSIQYQQLYAKALKKM